MFFKGVGIMSFRIAVASNDGITIDQHFGKADKFLIFQFEGTMIELIEERKNIPICGTNGHSEEKVYETIELISDCEVVFVNRIGIGPALALQEKGIKFYEVSIGINEALERFAKYKKMFNIE